MTAAALALVLSSAFLHATWNAILKGGDDRLLVSWGTNLVGGLVVVPLVIFHGLPAGESLRFLLLSALLHSVYNVTLMQAYEHGDLSFVYPIARGLAPTLSSIGALLLFRERLPWPAAAGVLLVAGGVTLFGLVGRRASVPRAALGWSLATAAMISMYTLVDRQGVRLGALGAYVGALNVCNALTMSAYYVARRRALPRPPRALWRSLIVGGVCGVAAYGLVLGALALGKVAYVAALRETSVLFATWIGWRRFGDAQGPSRLWLSGLVAAGLALLVSFR
jgi:drug/metabolite transporter (DMT)-like permease